LVDVLVSQGFYVPSTEEIKSGQARMLGITHIESISRADLILTTDHLLDRLRFERRHRIEELYFISPEDLILSKLVWRERSQSEKQWRDILGILKVQTNRLDYAYLTQWANQLNIRDSLTQALTEAGI
jgi:hypothetical protein